MSDLLLSVLDLIPLRRGQSSRDALVASQALARSKPDGYTFIMVLAAHAINDSLYPKLPYDTQKDFAPVSLVANLPMIVAGSKSLKAKNIQALIAEVCAILA